MFLRRDAERLHVVQAADDVTLAVAKLTFSRLEVALHLLYVALNLEERLGKAYELVVQVVRLAQNLLHILVHAEILPHGMYQLKCHEQVRRREHDDVLLIGILQQRGVGLQGCRIATLVGNEHQDVADAVGHQLLVVLG